MFYHNFKYSLKTLLRNKTLIFWTLAFPIIMAILFNLAFSNIENSEKFDAINIAVVKTSLNENFKTALDNLSNNENKIFNTIYTDTEKAKEMLKDEKISGYLENENEEIKITVNKSGINETIIRYVIDEVNSTNKIITDLSKEKIEENIKNGEFNINYENIYQEVIKLVQNNETNIKDITSSKLSYTMIEYYTLIAMTALYGGALSMFITNYKIANINSVGKRTTISPIKKGSMLISSLLASFIIEIICLALLFLFTIFILKIDYGNNLGLIILLGFIGSFAGLTLGVAISTTIKAGENAKIGILIAITMLFCFLSGMMGITMKYTIDKNIPILNIINPANMITDGLYSLYYYDTYNRYFFNLVSLLVFSLIMILISNKELRRQKYDSI